MKVFSVGSPSIRTLGLIVAGGLVIAGSLLVGRSGPNVAESPCAAPAIVDDGWQNAVPETAGFDGADLCAVLEGVARGPANIHGVIVERHGRLVGELYRRGKDRSVWSLVTRETEFGPTVLHDLRSVTKTVVGLLFGIVREQHGIDLHTSPFTFYPNFAHAAFAAGQDITLEHLLTMSSGLEWNESVTSYGTLANDETRLFWDWAPARYVLSRPSLAAPGTHFTYNGGGTAVLADIVVRVPKMPLREWARTALFDPLGIHEWEWAGDLYGRPLAFAGLRMRPRDVAKLGRLVLAHGQWQGRQIVPSDWLSDSLRAHIAATDGLQYGYQWWVGDVDWHGHTLPWDAAVGNGGQRLFVVPDLDLTVTITAGSYNDRGIGRTINGVFRRVVAAVRE
jgi:CubicO group peptidase (beta-lactamase class C family)